MLGYSDRGSFDRSKMPPQLKALLDNFAENTSKPSNFTSTHPSWNASFSTRADEGVLLETAEWGQDAPFNAETPMFGDQHAPTGCVATAMAIVMKYHNWPETYNWDAMPMKIEYDGENPPAANPELARLMKDAGEAVYMAYGPAESGANMNWVGHRMQYTFHYSPDCQFISSKYFPAEQWVKMLKDNLNNGNPVIYSGSGSGSHAFVLDGYNTEGYHVNWGWDGWYNGYYALDALAPNDMQNFSENTGMVMNITPDKTGNIYSECFVDNGYLYGLGDDLVPPMNISVENVKKGEVFHIANQTATFPNEFTGQYGIALVSKDNEIKEVLQTTYIQPVEPNREFPYRGHTINFVNLIVTTDIDPSDRLQLVTKKDGEDEYRLVLGTIEYASSIGVVNNKPQLINVTINIGSGVNFSYLITTNQEISLEEGTHVLKDVLKGLSMGYTCSPKEYDKNKVLILTLKGTYVYGDIRSFRTQEGYLASSATLQSDYVIDAQIYDMQDKIVTLEKAGTLKDKLADVEKNSLRSLTLKGKINALDFWYIRDYCPALETLDLSDTEIEEVVADDTKYTFFDREPLNKANAIPRFALMGQGAIQKLVLPESATVISDDALGALDLLSINFPAGITSIGLNALYANPKLQAIGFMNPDPVRINDCVLAGTLCPENGYLFIPEGSAQKYKETAVWRDFSNIIEGTLPDKIKYEFDEGNYHYEGFLNTATLTKYTGEEKDIIIPESLNIDGATVKVTGIGKEAFYQNNNLETIVLPNSLETIGNYAFYGCQNLKKVILGDNLRSIGGGAFGWCQNLKECNLGENLEVIGYSSFKGAGIESVYLNKKVVADDPFISPFGYNHDLKEFIVDKDNKFFIAIDGVLYRPEADGLSLECVPGKKNGIFTLPDNCIKIREDAIGNTNLSSLVINKNCKDISRWAISGGEISHITLPPHSIVHESAIQNCNKLETITFTGNLSMRDNIIYNCKNLQNIIVDAPNEIVELDGIFYSNYQPETLNIFTSSAEKNFNYSGKYKLFVAGATSDEFANDEAEEVQEMWGYGIDREEKVLTITPQVNGLAIERVLVNGKEAENIYYSRAESAPAFVCAVDDPDNLNVTVEYSLFGSQKMSYEYKSEFNSELPHTQSGINQVWIDSSVAAEVYTTDGLLIRKAIGNEALKDLRPGVYIIREGNRSRKVVIKK
ncbi:MAG: C10 family peptidase [Muribaculaceae bacterium]|nr:C10 family peptidase [Muribaculaceae bacterium]